MVDKRKCCKPLAGMPSMTPTTFLSIKECFVQKVTKANNNLLRKISKNQKKSLCTKQTNLINLFVNSFSRFHNKSMSSKI